MLRKTLPILVAGLLGFCAVALIVTVAESFFLSSFGLHSDEPTHGSGSPTVIAIVTILGIISKRLYDALSPRANAETAAKPVTLRAALASIFTAVIISPVVILALYRTISDVDDDLLVYLLCYQNGFFWQTLTSGRAEAA